MVFMVAHSTHTQTFCRGLRKIAPPKVLMRVTRKRWMRVSPLLTCRRMRLGFAILFRFTDVNNKRADFFRCDESFMNMNKTVGSLFLVANYDCNCVHLIIAPFKPLTMCLSLFVFPHELSYFYIVCHRHDCHYVQNDDGEFCYLFYVSSCLLLAACLSIAAKLEDENFIQIMYQWHRKFASWLLLVRKSGFL